MTCRCDGSGWLPEMWMGRWRLRCPGSDGYTKNVRNVEAFEHVEQLCAKCEAMREKREVNMCDYFHPTGCTCHKTPEGAAW